MERTGMFPAKGNNRNGYTLLELLVSLGVIALMATLIPTLFINYVPAVAVKEKADEISTTLADLRDQARITGKPQTFTAESPDKDGFDISLSPHPDFEDASSEKIDFYANGRNSGGVLTIKKGEKTQRLIIDWLTGRIERLDG